MSKNQRHFFNIFIIFFSQCQLSLYLKESYNLIPFTIIFKMIYFKLNLDLDLVPWERTHAHLHGWTYITSLPQKTNNQNNKNNNRQTGMNTKNDSNDNNNKTITPRTTTTTTTTTTTAVAAATTT